MFDPTIRGSNGNGTWEWSCGDGISAWPYGTSVKTVRCNADSSVVQPEVKCGPATVAVYDKAPTSYLCEFGTVSSKVRFDSTSLDSNGHGTWLWGCGDSPITGGVSNYTVQCEARSSLSPSIKVEVDTSKKYNFTPSSAADVMATMTIPFTWTSENPIIGSESATYK